MIKNHPSEKIIERKDKSVMKRSRVNEELCLISQVEPKNIDESCKDEYWKQAMEDKIGSNSKEWDIGIGTHPSKQECDRN